jgi:hypothetical protein
MSFCRPTNGDYLTYLKYEEKATPCHFWLSFYDPEGTPMFIVRESTRPISATDMNRFIDSAHKSVLI